ncbi:hypothetical protein U9M48_019034 [Paspalum notatum var. saurae]|uniref:Uncharacterized protein n=1 Tax=Paspalum notatum var. saurae TaxID=547442 RepID=A0AAQ3TEG5_PASNO
MRVASRLRRARARRRVRAAARYHAAGGRRKTEGDLQATPVVWFIYIVNRALFTESARSCMLAPGIYDPANEELPSEQPLIEEPEDEPEDPHSTADHLAEEAPSNPSGEDG